MVSYFLAAVMHFFIEIFYERRGDQSGRAYEKNKQTSEGAVTVWWTSKKRVSEDRIGDQ